MSIKTFVKKHLLTNVFMEKMLIPLSRAIPFSVKLIPGNKMYPKGSQRKVHRNGIYFDLDISDYQEHLIYFGLENDSSIGILEYLPKKDAFILDIGANIGQTSLWMAKHIQNTNSTIISFEPFPSTFEKLEKNVGLNQFKSIKIENLGLGATESEMEMAMHTRSNSGGFRMHNPKYHTGKICKSISVTTLDKYLTAYEAKVDFIKIDVEGYEYQVLSGAVKTLKNHPTLYLEIDDNN